MEYKKVCSYITRDPILKIVQSTLHFTSLTDLFNQTPSRLLWEASSHMLQLMREGCSYTYPPLSIARYSFIQLSDLEQCRVTKLAQGVNTAIHDSNLGSLSRELKALPEPLGSTRIIYKLSTAGRIHQGALTVKMTQVIISQNQCVKK